MQDAETPSVDVFARVRMFSMRVDTGWKLWGGVVFDAMGVNI